MAPDDRPRQLIVVLGTGTDIGKTWVSARFLRGLRAAGVSVAARKPAQSFAPEDAPDERDAAVLARATGEAPSAVCREERWYEVPMAPPMAAEVLGKESFTILDLVAEIEWPQRLDVGLVETAGGVRSPLAHDGDCLSFCGVLTPDVGILVADAGLGTINSVRLTHDALARVGIPIVVILNRFDQSSELHRRNLAWLQDRDGFNVVVSEDGTARSWPGGDEDFARGLQRVLPSFELS